MRGPALALCALIGCRDGGFAPEDASHDAGRDAAVDGPRGPSGLGRRCSDERDLREVKAGCRGGQQCFTAGRGFRGGYCTQSCLTAPCPDDGLCVSEGSVRYCLLRCDDDAACRTDEGYVCAPPAFGLPPACIANPEPLGTRDGLACAPEAGRDAGVGDEAVSADRDDADTEANPQVRLHPGDRSALVAYLARSPRGDFFGGLSRHDGTGWRHLAPLTDFEFNNVVDPSFVYFRDGALFAAWLGLTLDRPSPGLRFAVSDDRGARFTEARSVAPEGRCAGGCDPPVVTLVEGTTERVMVAYLTRSTRRDAWVTVQSSDDRGARFSAPVALAGVRPAPGDNTLTPTLVSVASDAFGHVAVAWIDQRRDNPRAALGDSQNTLRVALSNDRGDHFGAPESVAPPGPGVVGHRPALAFSAGRLHALWVEGLDDGRWALRLGTRSLSAPTAWALRAVTRGSEGCATHGWPALALSARGDRLAALWLDNRSGVGAAWLGACGLAPDSPCGEPERLSSRPFRLSTGADPTRWHGTHAALAIGADGTLFAAWSDTRNGGPAVQLARRPGW